MSADEEQTSGRTTIMLSEEETGLTTHKITVAIVIPTYKMHWKI